MSAIIALDATETTWRDVYRATNLFAGEGLAPLWATEPFTAELTSGGKIDCARGTVLMETRAGESAAVCARLRDRFGLAPMNVTRLDGFAGLPIRAIRIAVYGGGGSPYNHAAVFAELGFAVDFVSPQEVVAGQLSQFDAFAMPGGGWRWMPGQLDPLGEAGCRAIADFVRAGGMYLGSCAGAFDAAIVSKDFLAKCPHQRALQIINAAVWNDSSVDTPGLQSPGVGVVECRLAQSDHPVTFGMPERFSITHYNGPFFELRPGIIAGASEAVGLTRVVGGTAAFTPAEQFLREAEPAEGTLLGRAAKEGVLNAVAGRLGLGRVVLFGSHPELGLGLDLDNWGAPARMLANAAFWQSSHVAAHRQRRPMHAPGVARSVPAGNGLSAVAARLASVTNAAEALLARDAADARWLANDLAMSTFGTSGAEIWRRNLDAFATVANHIKATLAELEAAVAAAANLTETSSAAPIADALVALEQAIHFRSPPEWNIDVGYEGVLQQIDRAAKLLREADAAFDETFAPDPNAYAYATTSPYQLAVGSYLSAIGVFANCGLLLRIQKNRLDQASARLTDVFRGVGKDRSNDVDRHQSSPEMESVV